MKKIIILANDTTYTYNLRYEIIHRLIAEGSIVIVVSQILQFRDELNAMGCRLIDLYTARRGTNPLDDLQLLSRYLRILKAEKPDLVLSFNIKPNVYGGMACRILGIRYMPNVTGLGTALEYPGKMQMLTSLLYKMGIAGAECVFFQNVENKVFFEKRRMLSPKSRICMLPGSGVNLVRHCFEMYPDDDGMGKYIFVIIGRLMRDKGTDEVLYAARKIKTEYPNVVFRFLGFYDDNFEDKIKSAVDGGFVEHLGEVENVHVHIKESHATIHASHHEGMANVLLESAACGRPVITTDVPGCRETLDDGISGLLFNPRDGESLVKAIRQFINLPYECKIQMGIMGRKKMESEFDRSIVVEKYIQELNVDKKVKDAYEVI